MFLLREGYQLLQQNSNLIGKITCEKTLGGGKENEDNRQTHCHPLLSGIRKQGMAAASSYSHQRLRKGHRHRQQNSNLFEKITP